MTLIVSLRIPDGIVIAGDSLATMMGQIQVQTEVQVKCPECGQEHATTVDVPAPFVPSTTFSFAQKLSPFLKKYGVGSFGTGMLMGKSIYYILREFEQVCSASQNLRRINGVSDVAKDIGNHYHSLLKQQLDQENKSLEDIPEDANALGFQVVGYDGSDAKTVEIHIGRVVTTNVHDQGGCTISGQPMVSQAIWSLYNDALQRPAFEVFSLQDAIAYAEFLINTTATHQRFSHTMPNVGGEIDIALVTPFDDFKWIRQKELSQFLGRTNE